MSEAEQDRQENLPAPVRRVEAERGGWLALINPNNAMRVVRGIGHLVGTASKVSNKVAQTVRDNRARDTVSAAVAERIAKGIEGADPRFERAFEREAERLLRDQGTIDDIAEIAMDELGGKTEKDFEAGELDEDWLYQFEQAAKGFSSDRMKHTFGRLLAGEILKPGSFSPATLKAVATMSSKDAQLIVTYLSMAYAPILGVRSTLSPQLLTAGLAPGSNGLAPFGLNYSNLSLLQQCGFLSYELTTHRAVTEVLLTGIHSLIGAKVCRFLPMQTPEAQRPLKLSGLLMTQVGEEIARIVEVKNPPADYLTTLAAHMEKTHKLQLLQT